MFYLRTYNGIPISKGKGAPCIEDIAVMQGRICRFNGATTKYWPVLLHSLAVADLVQQCYSNDYLELCALLHDSAEVVISDVPRSIKLRSQYRQERKYLKNIYKTLVVRYPNKAARRLIARADNSIGYAECALLAHPHIKYDFPYLSIPSGRQAEDIVSRYLEYSFEDVLQPDGRYVLEYITRLTHLLIKDL